MRVTPIIVRAAEAVLRSDLERALALTQGSTEVPVPVPLQARAPTGMTSDTTWFRDCAISHGIIRASYFLPNSVSLIH